MLTYRQFQKFKHLIKYDHVAFLIKNRDPFDCSGDTEVFWTAAGTSSSEQLVQDFVEETISEQTLQSYRNNYQQSFNEWTPSDSTIIIPNRVQCETSADLEAKLDQLKHDRELLTPPAKKQIAEPERCIDILDTCTIWQEVAITSLIRQAAVSKLDFTQPKVECQDCRSTYSTCKTCQSRDVQHVVSILDKFTAAWTIWTVIKRLYPNLQDLHEKIWSPGGPMFSNGWELLSSGQSDKYR